MSRIPAPAWCSPIGTVAPANTPKTTTQTVISSRQRSRAKQRLLPLCGANAAPQSLHLWNRSFEDCGMKLPYVKFLFFLAEVPPKSAIWQQQIVGSADIFCLADGGSKLKLN